MGSALSATPFSTCRFDFPIAKGIGRPVDFGVLLWPFNKFRKFQYNLGGKLYPTSYKCETFLHYRVVWFNIAHDMTPN